jgi:8-amino-7-oxononanoate synthase
MEYMRPLVDEVQERGLHPYIRALVNEVQERDLYPDIKNVEEVPYPELVIEGRRYLCFCSNNYLGLSIHPEVKRAAMEAIEKYGIGTCESRLVAGNLTILEDLERAIADFKQAPEAIIYLSGYMTNIGVIPTIMDGIELPGLPSIKNEDNLIIKDALCHVSIVDGCMLSRSPKKTYSHKDMNHLEHILKKNIEKRKLIITDGVFSMDGDMAPLPDIVELAQTYDAMVMIDDAHATGIIGENGRGTAEYFGVEGKIDIVMGTLSKAIGALGGFVTASPEIIKNLRMRSHSYIFSSSLPPEQACGIMAALRIIQNEPELRANFWRNVYYLKTGLQEMGFDTLDSETQIIPIFIGDEEKSIQMARLLFDKGILAPAMRWPAVPIGRSRIRCSVTAVHTQSQIDYALDAFCEAGREAGII